MHGGEVVWHDFIAGYQKRALYQALDALPIDLNIEHQRQLRLTLQGYFEPIVDSREGDISQPVSKLIWRHIVLLPIG